MAALIQHFGDTADGLPPLRSHLRFYTAKRHRPNLPHPTKEEDRQLRTILRALDGQTRVHRQAPHRALHQPLRNTPAADRKIFDTLLDALVRSGLIT